ncbi:YbaB/EbfC family nucleoid-associated protein [Dactylosporangium sp. CA-092794]|uniref:YbaB/EbfC family nucleoid-associated protein n=1 Tax=Dactylosporangium sp. CA-092794 TaxID=3239929 RepID=UPI003D8B2056
MEHDLGKLRALAESLTAESRRIRASMGDLQRDLAAIAASATSPDGLVKATVGFRGQVVSLDLDPRVYRRPDSKALADTIVATIQSATVEAGKRVDELSARLSPTLDVRSALEGDAASRLSRYDFIFDELDTKENR